MFCPGPASVLYLQRLTAEGFVLQPAVSPGLQLLGGVVAAGLALLLLLHHRLQSVLQPALIVVLHCILYLVLHLALHLALYLVLHLVLHCTCTPCCR